MFEQLKEPSADKILMLMQLQLRTSFVASWSPRCWTATTKSGATDPGHMHAALNEQSSPESYGSEVEVLAQHMRNTSSIPRNLMRQDSWLTKEKLKLLCGLQI